MPVAWAAYHESGKETNMSLLTKDDVRGVFPPIVTP